MTATLPTRSHAGVDVPAAGTYEIDASHTHVGFSVRHVMVSRTRGRFADVSGQIEIGDDPLASSVDVTIQAASIDSRNEDRDAHLRSPDFLDVDRYPTLRYQSTAVRPNGDGSYTVDGRLTIKEITREVPLRVEFEGAAADPWGSGRIGFTAAAEIDREDFGIVWNQALETGGVLVGRTAKIELEVEAIRG